MHLVEHPEVCDEPWFAAGSTRAEHAELLDGYVGAWIAERDLHEVLKGFEDADAAIAPIYDVSDVFTDPQYQALDTITTVEDPVLGDVRMQNVLFRMSETPGAIRWTGRPLGADTASVLQQRLGLSPEELTELESQGVISTGGAQE